MKINSADVKASSDLFAVWAEDVQTHEIEVYEMGLEYHGAWCLYAESKTSASAAVWDEAKKCYVGMLSRWGSHRSLKAELVDAEAVSAA